MYNNSYFFIDKYIFLETKYNYSFFDVLVRNSGYTVSKNSNEHYFYNWEFIPTKFLTDYSKYSFDNIKEIFKNSYQPMYNTLFYTRVLHHLPLIIISFEEIIEMMEDLKYETDMGWEAISICGNYIIEFTDRYKSEIRTNF